MAIFDNNINKLTYYPKSHILEQSALSHLLPRGLVNT